MAVMKTLATMPYGGSCRGAGRCWHSLDGVRMAGSCPTVGCMHEGVVRPRALRASRLDGWAMHGTPAEQVPTFSFVRRLDLTDAHPLEDDVDMPGQEVHARACEVQRGHGGGIQCDRKSAEANVGMAHAAHDAGNPILMHGPSGGDTLCI